jgi:hypothetical protein
MEQKKKAFSYSTYEETRANAMGRAAREGTNLSEVIHTFLTDYGKPLISDPMPGAVTEHSDKHAVTPPASTRPGSKPSLKGGKATGHKR